MRSVAGRLRLDLAQYRELVTFAQFGTSDLDRSTREQLERGQRITEVLKQPQYQPLPLANQVTIMFAVTNGYLDDVPVENVAEWEEGFHKFIEANHPKIAESITQTNEIDDETQKSLVGAIEAYKQTVSFD